MTPRRSKSANMEARLWYESNISRLPAFDSHHRKDPVRVCKRHICCNLTRSLVTWCVCVRTYVWAVEKEPNRGSHSELTCRKRLESRTDYLVTGSRNVERQRGRPAEGTGDRWSGKIKDDIAVASCVNSFSVIVTIHEAMFRVALEHCSGHDARCRWCI